jgi:hypothetical protein
VWQPRYSQRTAKQLWLKTVGIMEEATMALQFVATGASILTELTLIGASAREAVRRLAAPFAMHLRDAFDPYRPELHYMRGPGPKWREKHGVAGRNTPGRRST